MIAGIIIGIIVGLISYIPFEIAVRKVKKVNPTNSAGLAGWFFFAIAISFLVLFGSILLCRFLASSMALAYAIAAIASFIVMVIVMSLLRLNKKK